MDPTTASYYRAVLFADGLEPRRLPESLMRLHQWVQKRHLAMGLNGTISKAMALNVSLTWLSSTDEGREFSCNNLPLGGLFTAEGAAASDVTAETEDDSEDEEPVLSVSDGSWDSIEPETDVIVHVKDDTTIAGKFIASRGSWTDVRVDGEVRHFRTSKVQLSGA
jgi:hypothetical protein